MLTITELLNTVFKEERNTNELARFDRYLKTNGLRGTDMKFVIYKDKHSRTIYYTNIEIGTVAEIIGIQSEYYDTGEVVMILDANHEAIYINESKIKKALI